MNEQELNKKLAEWAGYKYRSYQVYEYEHKDTRIEDPYWSDPDGKRCLAPPNFPQSLDACFKWLVPKLQAYHLTNTKNGFHLAIVWIAEPNFQRSVDKNPALALCLAIEKLIDKEKEESLCETGVK